MMHAVDKDLCVIRMETKKERPRYQNSRTGSRI